MLFYLELKNGPHINHLYLTWITSLNEPCETELITHSEWEIYWCMMEATFSWLIHLQPHCSPVWNVIEIRIPKLLQCPFKVFGKYINRWIRIDQHFLGIRKLQICEILPIYRANVWSMTSIRTVTAAQTSNMQPGADSKTCESVSDLQQREDHTSECCVSGEWSIHVWIKPGIIPFPSTV